MSDFRNFVMDAIKPLLPKEWKYVPYASELGPIDRVTVMLLLDTVEREPAAPNSQRLCSYNLLVIEPKTQPGVADSALDDSLMNLLDALDDQKRIRWTRAERSTYAESNPAYSITIQALAEKE